MGCICSLFKRHNVITDKEVIKFLEDLREQIIFNTLDNPSLLNKYKIRHVEQILTLYKRNDERPDLFHFNPH